MTATPIGPAQGASERIGSLVFVSADVHVNRGRLAALLTSHGVRLREDLPDTITAQEAFSIACPRGTLADFTPDGAGADPSDTADNTTKPPAQMSLWLEAIDLGTDRLTVSLQRPHRSGPGDLFRQVAKVGLDQHASTPRLTISRVPLPSKYPHLVQLSPAEERFLQTNLKRIQDDFQAALGLLPEQALMNVITEVLTHAGAVSLLEEPGVFFVPRERDAVIATVRSIVSEFTAHTADTYVATEPVYAGQHELRTLIGHAPIYDDAPVVAAQTGPDVLGHLVLRKIPEHHLPSSLPYVLKSFDIARDVRLPKQVSPSQAFLAACELMVNYRLYVDTKVRIETSFIAKSDDVTVVRVVRLCCTPTATTETTLASVWLTRTTTNETGPTLRFGLQRDDDAINELLGWEQRAVGDLLANIDAAYHNAAGAFPSDTLHQIVDQLLAKASAIGVGPTGSVSFVPTTDDDVLPAIEQVVRTVAVEPENTHFVTLPVIRKTELADVVTKIAVQRARLWIKGLEDDIGQWDSPGQRLWPPAVVTKFTDATQQLATKLDRYAGVLPTAVQDECNHRILQLRSTIAKYAPDSTTEGQSS